MCRTLFHKCTAVISWAKQTNTKNSRNGSEIELVIMLTERNAFPSNGCGDTFQEFWVCFVQLVGFGAFQLPEHSQSTPTFLVCAYECCLLFPDEKDILNKLIRWNFPMQLLSSNGNAAWHVRNEKYASVLFNLDQPSSSSLSSQGQSKIGKHLPDYSTCSRKCQIWSLALGLILWHAYLN